MNIATNMWHPYDTLQQLPDRLIVAIFDTLSRSKIERSKKRLLTLKTWRQWANDLAKTERELHEGMPAHTRRVMKCKRLALLEKIAVEVLDWPDVSLFQELREGFKLTGNIPATGVFKRQARPASMSVEELMQAAKVLRPAIIGLRKSNASNNTAKELYDITMDEAQSKGWLNGPMTFEEVTRTVVSGCLSGGSLWSKGLRSGLQMISARTSQLNLAVSTVDKISLNTLHHISWVAMAFCKHALHEGHMKFKLSNGETLCGEVHSDWKGDGRLQATTLDLKSAYKQLPLHKEKMNKTVVALCNPEDREAKFFTMNTLPFGAVASVLHFNRVSTLLWACGCHLGVMWSSYFGDYPILCPHGLESSTMSAVKAMLGLFGFVYAEDKLQDLS